MLVHHSNRDYNEAASEAAKEAKIKMQERIHRGAMNATDTITKAMNMKIKDRVQYCEDMRFEHFLEKCEPDAFPRTFKTSMGLHIANPFESYKVHDHALIQAIQRSGLPNANKMLDLMRSHGDVGNELLEYNLNTLYKQSEKLNLIRTVDGEARGILSNRYRRMDSSRIIERFTDACKEIGAVPMNGKFEDTRVNLDAALPVVFEPVPHEVMIFGFSFQTSDFGNGALNCNLWTERLWCTNKARLDQILKQIHLGRRLDETINFSQKTIDLDTDLTAEKLYDTVVHCLNPTRVNIYLDGIKEANEAKMTSGQIDAYLLKRFQKLEKEEIIAKFNSADVEMLPPGQTRWRLSNAISWCANAIDDVDTKTRYEDAAGDLIPRKSRPVATVIEPIQ
jgi:hypothetical protein